MNPDSPRVLVTGGTGFIGGNLVKGLVAGGYETVCLVREQTEPGLLAELSVEIRRGDITDLRSLIEACTGVDVVVHLAAATSSESRDREKSFLVNVVGSQNVIDACRATQVKKAIFLGTQANNQGAYATSKREAENLFRDSEIEAVIIRPSLVYGPGGGGLLAGISRLISKLPVVPIVGSGEYPMKPIFVGDVTRVIMQCIDGDFVGKEYLISGPTTLPYRRFIDELERAMGLRKLKFSVPYPLVLVGIFLASFVLKNLPLSVDTLRGLVNPQVHDSKDAEKDLGFAPLDLDAGLQMTFAGAETER